MRLYSIPVQLAERSYPILIQSGLKNRLLRLAAPYSSKNSPVLLLTDSNVRRLYPKVIAAAQTAGWQVFSIPAGERSKHLGTVERLLAFMLRKRFDRSSLLVALGGGVVGDLGGFAASLYMRGIPFVQVPTTLLAQVDSSVGGKTGVNHPLGKNMIGTFYQPRAVFIDPEFLKTLPRREFMNGYAEVIKHAIIRDAKLFALLEKDHRRIFSRDPGLMEKIVAANCRIKAGVVSHDEREGGLRAILNFGHTFGHALETLTHYRGYSHGEAVMLGMKAATVAALKMRLIPEPEAGRLLAGLARAGFPPMKPLAISAVYRKMFSDKKARGGRLTIVVPRRIGRAETVIDPEPGAILAGIRSITAGC